MTQITYTVINRPKKDTTGKTYIGWDAECGRDAVPLGGYLITRRTLPGEKKQYTAIAITNEKNAAGRDNVAETVVGSSFETRATAAFAIWRKYYEGHRNVIANQRAHDEHIREQKRLDRERRREERQTPEGQRAYRDELNRKARERRANMSTEARDADAKRRRDNRLADSHQY